MFLSFWFRVIFHFHNYWEKGEQLFNFTARLGKLQEKGYLPFLAHDGSMGRLHIDLLIDPIKINIKIN